LQGPSRELISEIGGFAAYRALRTPASEGFPTPGALGPAALKLHRESASLQHIVRWPGMSLERSVRLLNGLYLTANLLVSRSHPNARRQPEAREFGKGHP
jgi:hypothetical protein